MERPAARTLAIAARSESGTRPSLSISTWTTEASYCRKVPSAPTYEGASTSTTSPGSIKIREMRSRACCEPVVITTSSGFARIPSSAITSQICSRSFGWPCPLPYCSASAPLVRISLFTTPAIISIGSAERFGIPPASETISGLDATAKSDLISEGNIPAAREANLFSRFCGAPVW